MEIKSSIAMNVYILELKLCRRECLSLSSFILRKKRVLLVGDTTSVAKMSRLALASHCFAEARPFVSVSSKSVSVFGRCRPPLSVRR